MARFDGKFEGDGGEPLGLEELLRMLEVGAPVPAALERARACYLSSSDGWRDAVKQLGGTFAGVGTEDLSNEK